MRRLLPLLITISFVLALAQKVRAEDVCVVVEDESWGFISCQSEEHVISLTYDSVWVWKKVQASGRHEEMLVSVCAEAVRVREIILVDPGQLEYLTECTQMAGR